MKLHHRSATAGRCQSTVRHSLYTFTGHCCHLMLFLSYIRISLRCTYCAMYLTPLVVLHYFVECNFVKPSIRHLKHLSYYGKGSRCNSDCLPQNLLFITSNSWQKPDLMQFLEFINIVFWLLADTDSQLNTFSMFPTWEPNDRFGIDPTSNEVGFRPNQSASPAGARYSPKGFLKTADGRSIRSEVSQCLWHFCVCL